MQVEDGYNYLDMPVPKDNNCDARNSWEYIEWRNTAWCGERHDKEAKDDGDSLGHIEECMLDWAEHGEDDRHADDVVDGMEHPRENQKSMVYVVEWENSVEHLKDSFGVEEKNKDGGEGEYE